MTSVEDFVIEEYKQIVAAFFDLSKQKSDMFRFYLILVTIPITLIAAIFGSKDSITSFLDLPILVVFVLFAVSVAGLIMAAIIVDIRFECILYAKTVNLVRRYFSDHNVGVKDYLLLPDGDDLPRFYEQPWEFKKRKWKWNLGVGSTFLQVILIGILNSTYFGLAVANISQSIAIIASCPQWVGLIFGIIFFFIHILGYWWFAKKKDSQWKVKFNTR